MVISGIGVILAILSVKISSISREMRKAPHWLTAMLLIKTSSTEQNSERCFKDYKGEPTVIKELETEHEDETWTKITCRLNLVLGLLYFVILLIGLIVTFSRYQGHF